MGGTGFDIHEQIRLRGDLAKRQATLEQGGSISVVGAGGQAAREMPSAGDDVEHSASELTRYGRTADISLSRQTGSRPPLSKTPFIKPNFRIA